jgi:hypothetical protein
VPPSVRCCRCTTSTFPEVKSGDEGLLQAGDVLLEGGPFQTLSFPGTPGRVREGRLAACQPVGA